MLFGRDRTGLLFRAADDYPAAPELLRAIEVAFGLDGDKVLRYDDTRRGHSRRLLIADGQLQAVSLAGDVAAAGWLKGYLQDGQSVALLGRRLLMLGAAPPTGFAFRGRIVCNCLDVAEQEINAALNTTEGSDEQRLTALNSCLQCGSG